MMGQFPVLLFQLKQAVGALDNNIQQFGIHRLLEEQPGAQTDGTDSILPVIVTCDHNNLGAGSQTENFLECCQAFSCPARVRWQPQIQSDDVWFIATQMSNSGFPILGGNDLKSFKGPAQSFLQARVILHLQQCFLGIFHPADSIGSALLSECSAVEATGRLIRKTVPLPGVLVTPSSPPNACMYSRLS